MVAKIYNAAKVGLNIHDESDLVCKPNMRVFEVPGCGSLLMTDKALGIERFFNPGKEILCYADEAELIELVSYYLDSPAESATIAARAHERAYRDHTYDHRLEKVLDTVS
jgi:spore maturation protein CgeB